MSNDKKVVVTGAGGFLGSNLVEMLKEKEDYVVYALSSFGDKLQKSNTSRNIQYCHKEAIFSDQGEQILKDAMVVNCAFPRNSTGTGMANGLRYIQRLFDCSKERGVKAIINISSQSVYSQMREEAATEETPICLESSYAVGKYAAELMLESVCSGTEIAYTNLRMASLIGPKFDQRIVNRFVKQGLNTGKLIVKRNQQRFGFFDIEDAVSGLETMLESDAKMWKPVYNLGGKGAYTLVEIAEAVRFVLNDIHKIDIEIEVTNSNEFVPVYKVEEYLSECINSVLLQTFTDFELNLGIPNGYSLEEIARCVASVTSRTCQLEIKTKNNSENHINSMIDCRKFYKDFSWQPKVSLELSVKKILKYEVRK